MSDPVTNMEIEDVLSSIRRLVAEGDKAKQEKKKEYGSIDPEPEKFVLTPALRIADTESAESAASLVLEDPVEVEAGSGTDELAFAEQSASLKDVFSGGTDAAPTVEPVDEVSDAMDQVADPEPIAEAETSMTSLEETIAALEAAVTGSDDEFEPDGSEMAPVSSWEDEEQVVFDSRRNDDEEAARIEPLELTPEQAVSPFPIAAEDAPEAAATEAEADETSKAATAEDDAPLPDTVAPAKTGRIFRVVPDRAEEDTSEVQEPLEPAVPQGTAAMYHGSEAVVEEDHGDDLLDEGDALAAPDDDIEGLLANGATLDEALIRQVVAEVVKGELEGKLGETITRNVRRLVRREINRVLTHQELE